MRQILVVVLLICALLTSSYTTLQPSEATPQEVQRLILTGDLLKPGDRMKIVKTDRSVYEFRIESIDLDQGLVIGVNEQVRIDDIIALETRQVSIGKTALLAGGVAYNGY